MATCGSVSSPQRSETLRSISVRISGSRRHQSPAPSAPSAPSGRCALSTTVKVPSAAIARSSRSNGSKVCRPPATGGPNGMIVTSGTVPRRPLMRYTPLPSIAALR